MLRASDLVKHYRGVTALDGFTLTVEPGEIAGLVGHNGAGKTTFFEIAAGLRAPDSGRVGTGGAVRLAPQQLALYPALTVRETVRLFGRLAGVRRPPVEEVAADLHLTEVLGRRVGVLSGGQQRRVQAATALVAAPPDAVLLLDEPTVGADPETRQALLAAVRRRADEGATVVYCTHYLPELAELEATIAVAASGRVIARGEGRELLKQLPGEVRVSTRDRELRVSTRDPARELAALLAHLAGLDEPVESIDIRRPSLDDLYRELSHGPHRRAG
ncbi:ABC transporter ATP-binding protein [Nonomuraea sp. NPDC050663]|uniref:ABC transporter ATP-binding protein n=1 Tax=Nonomuraea sp. NPDC050663 TaxID=3364370 RepID=UPI0037949962